MLDADNWLEPNHVEACVAAARSSARPCDYVIAARTFRRLDESVMDLPMPPEHTDLDTNLFFFLPGTFSLLPHWALMPKPMTAHGDVFFGKMLRQRGLVSARIRTPTVNYQNMWSHLYEELGETPPPGAKPPFDGAEVTGWIKSLSPRESEIAGRLAGFLLSGEARSAPPSPVTKRPQRDKVGRNDKCPCGSGQKYKHCHGAQGG
jgi:hypothetical protein